MAKLIYNKSKSHGNPSTPASGASVDTFKIKIPSGEKFSHFTISKSSGHSGASTFTVTKAPKANATGNVEIKVMWTNGPFSKCSYRLRAYSKVSQPNVTVPAPKPVVVFGNKDWYNLSIGYIQQKKPFILRLQGPDASKVINILNPIQSNLVMRRVVINEATTTLAITAAVCITIIAVSGLAVLGAVLLFSIYNRCAADAELDMEAAFNGLIKQELDIQVMSCQGPA